MHFTEGKLSTPGATLAWRSLSPQSPPWSRLLILHGYGDHIARYPHFMHELAQRGVESAGFDFRGHGKSTGRRGHIHRWSDYLDDLRAFLNSQSIQPRPPTFFLAHSHGALVLATAAIQGWITARGVIMTAPYFANAVPVPPHKAFLARLFNRILPAFPVSSGISPHWLTSDPLMIQDRIDDPLAFRFATPRWFATMQSAQQHALAGAGQFNLPLLMLLAGADSIARNDAADEFFNRAASPDKMRCLLPGMRHEILREAGRQQVFDQVLRWMSERSTPP